MVGNVDEPVDDKSDLIAHDLFSQPVGCVEQLERIAVQ